MSISDFLTQRMQELQQDFQACKDAIASLGEQMEMAKANYHMVSGRLQEVAHSLQTQPVPEQVSETIIEGETA